MGVDASWSHEFLEKIRNFPKLHASTSIAPRGERLLKALGTVKDHTPYLTNEQVSSVSSQTSRT